MTRFLPVTIDQPEGTVKVAPPGVTLGVSIANRSGADFAGADWDDGGVESDAAPSAKLVNARRAARTIRSMDILSPKSLTTREIAEPTQYTQHCCVAKREREP